MVDAIRHRGPNDIGRFEKSPIHLGFRRLSIIDPSGSAQPLFSENRNIIVVFNGEIYNYQVLRRELIALGHVFATRGDGEVLVHGWEEYGEDILNRISGMFAFAAWDEERQTLFLARDHFGVKPLYFYWHNGLFVFASERKAILRHPEIEREIDLNSLALYLECQYIPAPRSIYAHIRKLPAGCCLRFGPQGLTERSYWIPSCREKVNIDETEAVDMLNASLTNSVRSMLVSNVPLGAFISGGVDSGLVAGLMTELTGSPIETFNLGFVDELRHSEHEYALTVAQHIGSRHHLQMVDDAAVSDEIARWVEIFDEPFGDQAALPTLLLSRFAGDSVKIALTGEGADEILAGYEIMESENERKALQDFSVQSGVPCAFW